MASKNKNKNNKEENEEEEYTDEYPIGKGIERYDIEVEKELTQR